MIRLSPEAETQLDELLHHYERLGRIEAAENLLAALEQAGDQSRGAPAAGFPAPRRIPSLRHVACAGSRRAAIGSPTAPPPHR